MPEKFDSLSTYSHANPTFRREASIVEQIPQNVEEQIVKYVARVPGITEQEKALVKNLSHKSAVELLSVFTVSEFSRASIIRDGSHSYLLNPQPIAQGSFGMVYKGFDLVIARPIAFKITNKKNIEAVDAFRREAQAQANETHPNIVQVYNFLENFTATDAKYAGKAGIVMEYVDPLDSEVLSKLADKSPERLISIVKQVCSALDYLSSQKARKDRSEPFVDPQTLIEEERSHHHLDIKPSNIMVTADNKVKIADFGISNLVQKVGDTSIYGTARYLSPERLTRKEVTLRSELFSLTSVIYFSITGKNFFSPDSGQDTLPILIAVLKSQYQGLSPELEVYCDTHKLNKDKVNAFFEKAWQKDPDDRYQTADEYIQAFEDAFTATT